jgi:hypothetical protein
MRYRLIPILVLAILTTLPAAGLSGGGVDIRILDEPITDLADRAELTSRTTTRTAPVHRLTERTSSTTDSLLVPFFEVDRRGYQGVTTLFAVRNETSRELPVRILYLTNLDASAQAAQEVTIPAHAVHTVNLRDVEGLRPDEDGIARGLVVLGVIDGWQDDSDYLSGDFMVIDPQTGFSTGNTLVNVSVSDPENEFCSAWGTRFFNGGSLGARTDLTFTVDIPGGRNALDQPTAIGTVYDEQGTPIQSFELRTDRHTFSLPASEVAPRDLRNGTISLRFLGTEGVLMIEHSEQQRIALGMKAVCRDRVEE